MSKPKYIPFNERESEESKNVLYLIIGNEENTYKELEIVADEIISITTKYCGGKFTILK